MLNIGKSTPFLFAFILLFSFCFSCKSEQKERLKTEKLQINFYLRYLQPDKQVKAAISFSTLDTTKKVIPKKMEEVLFQEIVLDGQKSQNQYQYQTVQEMAFVENYSFGYRTNANANQKLDIRICPILDFIIKKGKISKKVGSSIKLEGKELQKNEALLLLISDKNTKTNTIKIQSLSDKLTINISPEQIANLEVGKATVYIVRQQTIEEKANNFIKGRTEFYTDAKNIEIID